MAITAAVASTAKPLTKAFISAAPLLLKLTTPSLTATAAAAAGEDWVITRDFSAVPLSVPSLLKKLVPVEKE